MGTPLTHLIKDLLQHDACETDAHDHERDKDYLHGLTIPPPAIRTRRRAENLGGVQEIAERLHPGDAGRGPKGTSSAGTEGKDRLVDENPRLLGLGAENSPSARCRSQVTAVQRNAMALLQLAARLQVRRLRLECPFTHASVSGHAGRCHPAAHGQSSTE